MDNTTTMSWETSKRPSTGFRMQLCGKPWSTNISANLIRVIKHLFNKATSAVLCNGSIADWFLTTGGLRKGCLPSPTLFNICLEMIRQRPKKITKALSALEAEQSPVSALLMTSIASRRRIRTGKISWASWQSLYSLRHGDQCQEDNLMTNNTSGINTEIKVNGQKVGTVTSSKYLDSVITV